MEPMLLDIIDKTLDEVILSFQEDRHVIFLNESERRRMLYGFVGRKLNSWSNSKKCMFRGCAKKSIKSHSIQKLGALRVVSTNSKVFTPQFDFELGRVVLAEKGLAQASVFPGFCTEHEKIFSIFEAKKNLDTPDALIQQIYRSICREVVRMECDLNQSEESISEYMRMRNERLMEMVNKRLSSLSSKDMSFKSFNYTDPVTSFIRRQLDDTRFVLTELKNEHLREIELSIYDESKDSLEPVILSIDVVLPVCLSGLGSFYVRDVNMTKRVFAILGVYPNDKEKTSKIVIHGKAEDAKYIHKYLSRLRNPFDILNMVEQWMIRGTDHWFISPELYRKKTEEHWRVILRELFVIPKGISHELQFSLLDDLRRSVIEDWHGKTLSASEKCILDRESAKLSFV